MKRMLAFLVLISCVGIGPAVAKDILVIPVPSGGFQYGSTDTSAAVLSKLLSDIASDVALKAARDHGPEAIHTFQKRGPFLLKTMRIWTESALNSGGRYAIQTWSSSKKFVPQVFTGGKDVGLNALHASIGFAQRGIDGLLKGSATDPTRTMGQKKTSSKPRDKRSPKKTTGSQNHAP
jgi:hypothetical protein